MTASWKNKLVGAVATGAIVAGLFPAAALGVGASVLDSTATTADPAGPGHVLTVTGLESGDTATYYQIIEQDLDTTDDDGNTVVGTQAWKLTEAVDANGDGVVDGTESTDFGHMGPGTDGIYGTEDDEEVPGLYVDEMVMAESDTTVTDDVVTSDTRQLTPAMVNAIAAAVVNNRATASGTATASESDDDGHYQITVTPATNEQGMYMFVAVPSDTDANYLYKPIFVSTDYYNSVSTPEDNTHQLDLLEGDNEDDYGNPIGVDYPPTSGSNSNAGVFKRSPLTIDKESGTKDDDGNIEDLQTDVAVGDTVDFTITVPMTTYSENYVAPQFYITDVLTDGLKLVSGSVDVVVKVGDTEITNMDRKNKDFVITEGKDINGDAINGFIVRFLADDPDLPTDGTVDKKDGFLYQPAIAPVCTITYQATVTTKDGATFAQQVNQMDNTATLNFSRDPNYIRNGYFTTDDEGNEVPDDSFDPNEPDGDEDTGELKDRTHHYTFDIDADILGTNQTGSTDDDGNVLDESEHDKTSEIRKIWVDANGEIIQSKTTSDVVKDGSEEDGVDGEYGWLEGAEFTLTKTQAHVTTGVGTAEFQTLDTPEEMKFKSSTHILDASGSNPTSDAKGYIAMKGLDAGVYVLKEIKAPLGYCFNPNIQYEITITPNYVKEEAATTENPDKATLDGKGSGDDLILKSYEVKIVTQKLDSQMNVIDGETVETISTYNIATDDDGNPLSTLNEDGTQDTTVTIDTTVTSFGSNETAMIVNKKLGLLPATGGSGIIFYLGVGGAVAMLASYLLSKTKEEDPLA